MVFWIEFWSQIGPAVGTLLVIITTLERFIPEQILSTINRYLRKLSHFFFNPYTAITFDEFPSEGFYGRSKAYTAIETYLGANFSLRADRLKANIEPGRRSLAFSMDDYEEIHEYYEGVKVSWTRDKSYPISNVISYRSNDEERRSYVMVFPRKHRDIITGPYLSRVLSEGKAIGKRNRRQRLYTNLSGDGDEGMMWSPVAFDHPASFDTLAMDPNKKKEIMDDLVEFTKGKEYYRRIGKPWKRGYLLYGPPGTGKSTMIAAMANFLNYDVYDLELTAVKDNTHLRKLMIEISKRAILVIEDIDCSLGITAKRKTNNMNSDEKDRKSEKIMKEIISGKTKKDDDDDSDDDEKDSKVTLSGLLNFIDGLWSASGGERIFVFTTNHIEKLDPALIRRGRMDKHIEMSYCCFEAFKILANNYLKIESHAKFDKIKCLLEEINISPADVAENLMPKSAGMGVDECLENLIIALQKLKEESHENRESATKSSPTNYVDTEGKVGAGKMWKRLKRRLIGVL